MIKGNELIEIGYQSGPLIGQMIKRINEHQKSGINDRQYLLNYHLELQSKLPVTMTLETSKP